MTRSRTIVSFVTKSLVCVCVALLVGCHHDLNRTWCPKYICKATAYPCISTMNKLEVNLIGANTCYSLMPDKIHLDPSKGLNPGNQIYCSPSPWVITEINPGRLAGSMWIRTPSSMGANYTQTGGVTFQLVDIPEGIYIAYDSRVSKKPDWLAEPDWVLATNETPNFIPNGATQPLYITISRPDKLNNKPYTLLEVWQRKLPMTKNTPIVIPGNLSGNPTLPAGLKPGDVCMYLVIIKPTTHIDCNHVLWNTKNVADYEYTSCDDCKEENGAERCRTEAEIRELARIRFEYQLNKDFPGGTHTLGEITSFRDGDCPEPSDLRKLVTDVRQSQVYKYHSEISFSPRKSWATVDITVNNETKSYTTSLGGLLHFEYLLDGNNRMYQIRLNRMVLNGTPIETDVGTFQDILVDMVVPATATCSDAIPPWATPCNGYRIEPNDFVASVAVTSERDPIFVLTQNSRAINVLVDHSAREFLFTGGPLHTTLRVNDEDVPVDIAVNLTGQFVNFAPVGLVGNEFVGTAECGDNSRNTTPITLDAGASFEFYNDPLPTDPNHFQWYEDYGLLTEHHWGTGKLVTIPPYALTFGVHHMTLLLRDGYGVTDVRRFNVEVADTVPPDLTIPNDVIRFQAMGETLPLSVSMGEASVNDVCCSQVLVTNDAPERLLFGAGETLVTWQADDGRGNLATKVQRVYVVAHPDGSIVAKASDAVQWLNGLVAKEQASLTARIAEPSCVLDLGRLIALANQLADTLGAMGVANNQTGARDTIVGRLRSSATALTEADALMTQSNENETQRAALRQEVLGKLGSVSGWMNEIAAMSDPGPGRLAPTCSLFPTGVMMCLVMCVMVARQLARKVGESPRT